jgi:hypothetical protein
MVYIKSYRVNIVQIVKITSSFASFFRRGGKYRIGGGNVKGGIKSYISFY